MPTYIQRTGISGFIYENGVTVGDVAIAVDQVLTEARLTFADASGYIVSEKITETDSGIEAYIHWIETNVLGVIWATGEFVGSKTITGASSSTVKTPASVENVLERTADTPVHTPLLHTHDVSSTGTGDDQTIYLDKKTKWIMAWRVTGANLTVCNFSATYPMMPVPLGISHVSFEVGAKMAKLVLQFDAVAACTCQILESEEELP